MTTYKVSVLDNEYDTLDTLKTDSKSAMVDYVVGMRELGYNIQSIVFVGNWMAIIVMVDGAIPIYPTQKEISHIDDMWFFSNRRDFEMIYDYELKRGVNNRRTTTIQTFD